MKQVASTAVFNKDGHLLVGRRLDNGRWSLPGGGLNFGEAPKDAARREAKEEASLDLHSLEFLVCKTIAGRTGKEVKVWAYKATTESEPDASNDPDNEFGEFRWINIENGLPEEISAHLHSPRNVVLEALGLLPLDLKKSLDSDDFSHIHKASDRNGGLTNHSTMMAAHPKELNKYKAHFDAIKSAPQVHFGTHIQRGHGESGPFKDAGISAKTLIEHPKGDVMIKPFHEKPEEKIKDSADRPTGGWSEMSSQNLYHSAGIGHLHQRVHATTVPTPRGEIPAIAIHLANDHKTIEELHDSGKTIPQHHKAAVADQAKKIAMMDFLTGNFDRHEGNLMIGPKGNLLAIDNSYGFAYKRDRGGTTAPAGVANARKKPAIDRFSHYFGLKATRSVSDAHSPHEPGNLTDASPEYKSQLKNAFAPTFEWWKQASPNIRSAMEQNLAHVTDPSMKEHVRANFNARADWLDKHAQIGLQNAHEDWATAPVDQFLPHQFANKIGGK